MRWLGVLLAWGLLVGAAQAQEGFAPVPTQFIAAMGGPGQSSGTNAEDWGLWRKDPGPRGLWLSLYPALAAAGGRAPAGWQFDSADWWLEEHGLIMEAPDFPLAPGRYLVTGGRETVAELTVHTPDADGAQKWELSGGATLEDVTHLACRSARYAPETPGAACVPDQAHASAFPVGPGEAMPPVRYCRKVDYAVLFLIGLPDES